MLITDLACDESLPWMRPKEKEKGERKKVTGEREKEEKEKVERREKEGKDCDRGPER